MPRSHRPRQEGGPRAPSSAAAKRTNRPVPTLALRAAGIALVLVVAGFFAMRAWLSGARIPSHGDAIARLGAAAAFAEGARLGAAGLHVESVPYFRRAAEANETWESRFNLSSALGNAALQVRSRAGIDEPVLRTSAERVRLVRESLAENDRALALARDRRARALTVLSRARAHWTWGFPVEALELAREARALDPEWEAPALFLAEVERDLASGGVTP